MRRRIVESRRRPADRDETVPAETRRRNMGKASIGLRAVVLAGVMAMALAACGGSSGGGTPKAGESGKPTKGGTITFLTLEDQFQDLDPQRNYTGENLAFASAYITRTLNAFKLSPDGKTANSLTPTWLPTPVPRTPTRPAGPGRSRTASSGRTGRT